MSLDLIVFNEEFSSDEMSRFSRIVDQSTKSSDAKKELSDCLTTISREYDKQNSKSASEMNDDDFRSFFNNMNT